jgi:adenylate kinase
LPLDLLILGPQGSGKGTQAKRIEAEYGVPQVSTGEMFRDAIARRTPLGLEVEPIYNAGKLIPDELTIGLIRERLAQDDAQRGFVLDGFPRNLAQAEALDELLEEIGRPLSIVFEFQVPDEVGLERMRARAAAEGRTDDTDEAMARRLAIYRQETEPLVERYLPTGKVVGIHADRSIDEVWTEVQQAIDQVEAAV